jgi:hypothetical protein
MEGWRMNKKLERISKGAFFPLFEILSYNLFEVTEENH